MMIYIFSAYLIAAIVMAGLLVSSVLRLKKVQGRKNAREMK